MINNIVKSNLKSNKLKNIMVIITIALTTCLLTSVGMVTDNIIRNQKEHTIQSYGNAHAYYRKLDQNEVESIKRHKDIEIVGENSSVVGQYEFDDTNIGLMYIDENALKLSNMELIEGEIPKKSNEIALDESILSKLGYKKTVGQNIKLSYIDEKGQLLNKEFKVTGILPKNVSGEITKNHTVVISKELIEEEGYNNKLRASIRVKNEDKLSQDEIRNKVNEIGDNLKLYKEDTVFNDMYLMWSKPDPMTIMSAIAVAMVVMISSILVIYNIFYISIVSRIQEYGKLKAIGTTKKQIKSMILREGMLLSLLSIPIGELLGFIISKTLISKLLNITAEVGITFDPTLRVSIIIGSAILTIITVYISLIKPMKIASTISPVEAMRYNGNNKYSKKLRKGYIDLDILKFTKANLSRNKKRTTITLLSLCLSGIVIMVASTAMGCFNTENMVRQGFAGDFKINHKYTGLDFEKEKEAFKNNNPLNEDLINEIKSIEGIKSVEEIREVTVTTLNQGRLLEEEPDLKIVENDLAGFSDVMIMKLEDLLGSGEINLDKIKSGEEIIINSATEHWHGYKVGDIVKITLPDGKVWEVKIQAVTNSHFGGSFITSIDFIKDIKYTTSLNIFVEKHKEKDVSTALKVISSNYDNLEYSSFKDEVEEYNKMNFVFGSMGYILIGVIGVISLVNLINTMITSIIARKREIGILQAIGMTDKQLLKMLKLEGLFYTVITLVSSLTVGSIVGYIVYKVMYNSGATYAVYKFPLIPAIVLVITMFIVQIYIGYFTNKIFKQESLIDRVRYSE